MEPGAQVELAGTPRRSEPYQLELAVIERPTRRQARS